MTNQGGLAGRLSALNLWMLGSVVVAAPWFFGAWEMWWFWPFMVLLLLSTALFGLRLCLGLPRREVEARGDGAANGAPWARRAWMRALLATGFLPFLTYLAVRAFQAPVRMDAERMLLLHVSAVLVGAQILFGVNRAQRRALFYAVLANVWLLWLYAMVNHGLTGSTRVLWAEGYAQYYREGRVSGTFFCPDHFAGVMELAFACGVALLLARESGMWLRVWGAVLVLAGLSGVVYSQSRGGGLTVVAITAGALVWGFAQWPAVIRRHFRIGVTALAAVALLMFGLLDTAYMTRFKAYFGLAANEPLTMATARRNLRHVALYSSRGRMIGGALRAWRLSPVLGIGPGMHQNLWPHVAASADGNRETGLWPSIDNDSFHSYEVHSDWVQLLEETGVVGMVLFLVAMAPVAGVLLYGLRREQRLCARSQWGHPAHQRFHLVLSGWLCGLGMAVHSLGDFNLQIPATVWLLAALLAIACAEAVRYAESG